MPAGTVYLVGAGPGHPDLLTLRAAALLQIADVIVYDRLIQPAVLDLASPAAERIFMGKRPDGPESQQDDIHTVLLRKSNEGKTVVRLKGGDPFMFGRGGEEAEFLAGHGVPFEVVPGVSSALAAPLRAGIPVTHRGVASSVAFVTGHEANDDVSGLDWPALARMHTLVFMMAVGNVRRIAARLIEDGRLASTPVAIIKSAYWDTEQIVTSTLDAIADEVDRLGIQPPATLVVGDVVRLRRKLAGTRMLPKSESL
ncbi:MAG: uroporphyrinogen-III C-methyltransferase [Acidobacteria bacterium]|nr:uroporphyrinogen-III C-methyltransferase [Acidobacteriota bacterium]